MRNQYSHHARSSRLFISLAIAILISVAFFGFDTLTGGLVRSYARTVGALFWGAAAGTFETIDGSGILKSRRSLAAENQQLRDDIERRSEESARFTALTAENADLAQLAGLRSTEGGGHAARVLSSFHSSPYGTFLIGAGKKDGIILGDIVLTPGGFVLGTVSDLDSHTATVRALFAPGDETELVIGESAFSATGRGAGNARASLSRDARVRVGDAATVPSLDGRAAAVVGLIEVASSSATQTLYLRVPANLDVLRFVFILPHDE